MFKNSNNFKIALQMRKTLNALYQSYYSYFRCRNFHFFAFAWTDPSSNRACRTNRFHKLFRSISQTSFCCSTPQFFLPDVLKKMKIRLCVLFCGGFTHAAVICVPFVGIVGIQWFWNSRLNQLCLCEISPVFRVNLCIHV